MTINRLVATLCVSIVVSGSAFSADIKIDVRNPSANGWGINHVTSGIPISKGVLNDPSLVTLRDIHKRAVPVQTEALARWPDGSVKWLLLDFQVDAKDRKNQTFQLATGVSLKDQVGQSEQPIIATLGELGASLDSGRIRIDIAQKPFRLLQSVWLDANGDGKYSDEERILNGGDIVLTAPDGTEFRASGSATSLKLEQTGPLRACVRISGRHANKRGTLFRYIIRLHVFAGQPYCRMDYTFINDNPVDLMTKIDAIHLDFITAQTNNRRLLNGEESAAHRLFQVDDRSFEIDNKKAGRRAKGWVGVAGPKSGFAIGVRDFWQNWPKGLEALGDRVRIAVCPDFATGRYDGKPIVEEAQLYYYLRKGTYEFKVGASRTHELWLNFFTSEEEATSLNRFYSSVDSPLLAQPTTDFISATRANGDSPPARKGSAYERYDSWFGSLFEQHLSDIEASREYGMLNYGDWYNPNWESWGNLEYDTTRCFATQYLRTGDRRWFDRASQCARHYMDVDVLHASNPKLHEYAATAKMQPGHIWLHQVGHTGGYYGRYVNGKYEDEAPLKMKGPYQLGMYNWGHQWIGGIFDYYLLTGDRRALEVATMSADTIARDCPTRFSDHIRDLGWPLNLEIAAYEATGKKRYLDAAMRQWNLLQKHYKPSKGFPVLLAYGHCNEPSVAKRCRGQNAYMFGLTLSGLARLHRNTKDPEILKGLTAGIDQLIRECWSEKDKSFYLSSCTCGRPERKPPALSSAVALSSEALAYESTITNNDEHLRIWKTGFQTMVNAGIESVAKGEQQGQSGYASAMFHFTPFALRALSR